MSLLFVLGLWLVVGGFVHRAQKRVRAALADSAPGDGHDALETSPVGADIPDTVPPDWVEAYRAEHGDSL